MHAASPQSAADDLDPQAADGPPTASTRSYRCSGFGTGCSECFTKALLADRHGFWKDITDADWQKILLTTTPDELAKIQLRAKPARPNPGRPATTRSSIWKTATPAKVIAAITLVQLARDRATVDLGGIRREWRPEEGRASPALLARAKAGLASAPIRSSRSASRSRR